MNCFEYTPKVNFGIIYKYTSPSGKSYIGQTIHSPKQRAKNNGEGYKNCSVFYAAIQKYGFDNFIFQILAEVPISQLDEKEKYYIELYKTKVPNGYNISSGGKNDTLGEKNKVQIIKYNSQGQKICEFESITQAANEIGAYPQTISQVLRHERSHYKGYVYCYKNEKPSIVIPQKTQGRMTAQYTLQGELLATYPSANQAALAIGKNSNAGRNIRSVCEGKRKTAFGFIWKYLD